ncbi:MAG: Hpt domain-containing protein [Candidatus Sericytochromatia bacterium]
MNDDEIRARTRAAIMAVWATNRGLYAERASALSRTAEAARTAGLSPEARAEAADHAHKVAGAVGTFGYHEASRAAKAIERLLKGDAPLTPEQAQAFVALATELKARLAAEPEA